MRIVIGGPGSRWRSQNVEDNVGGMDAVADGLGASCLDGLQSIGEHRGQDVDHLSIAVIGRPASLRRTRSIAAGSTQSLNGAPRLDRSP